MENIGESAELHKAVHTIDEAYNSTDIVVFFFVSDMGIQQKNHHHTTQIDSISTIERKLTIRIEFDINT